ncbi:MAG: gamma-glutamyl-gamma-aminobutyrate hydrolase family protein [Gemmatimonadetes bacterium]|nr:gamma-glutamyl-gamma-aminobutyrate hydrolase family protein [Gemmatimonadota bacterium]
MAARVVVGVPAQTLQAMDGIPDDVPHSWIMSSRYFDALTWAGAVPWMVPLLEEEDVLRAMYDRMDGVFLAGGVDVDPLTYGTPKVDACGRTDSDRDRVEILLARWALADGKPVLGVCRGLQVINVAQGGSLYQDLAAELPGSIKHDYYPTQGFERSYRAHAVRIAEGSLLHDAFASDEASVNSMHHQGVRALGKDLRAVAWSSDGLVEAIEADGPAWFVGVQWHPEALIETCYVTRRLLRAFVDACAARAAGALVSA